MATKKTEKDSLSPYAAFWKAAGIDMPSGHKAAEIARKALKDNGAAYVPMGESADELVIAANVISESFATEAAAKKNSAIIMAWIDKTEAYKRALSANGKPYTSTLSFARDIFPGMEKSTVANLVGAGRYVYTPAIEGAYDADTNKALMGISPSAAVRLKGAMGDKSTEDERKTAVNAVMNVIREKGVLSKKDADEIAKNAKNPSRETARGKTDTTRKQSRKEIRDHYNAQFRRILPASNVIINDRGLTVTVGKEYINVLKTMLSVAEVSENQDVRVALLGALKEALFGKG